MPTSNTESISWSSNGFNKTIVTLEGGFKVYPDMSENFYNGAFANSMVLGAIKTRMSYSLSNSGHFNDTQ